MIPALILAAALQYQPVIMAAVSAQWGDHDRTALIAGIADTESSWRPAARSPTNAKGLMQFTTIARKQVCKLDPRLCGFDPDRPKQAIPAAVVLLAHYHRIFYRKTGCQRWRAAVASYNAGPGGYKKASGYANKVLRAEQRFLAAGWPGRGVC